MKTTPSLRTSHQFRIFIWSNSDLYRFLNLREPFKFQSRCFERASWSFVTSDNKYATIRLSYAEDGGISSITGTKPQWKTSITTWKTSISQWGRSHERRCWRILRQPRIQMTAFLSLFLFLLFLLLLYQSSSSTGVCSAIRSVRAGSKLHSHAHRPWNTGCEMQLLHASLAGVPRICKGPSLRPY